MSFSSAPLLGVAVGVTAVTGGTDGKLLYDNAGAIGELTVGSGLSVSAGTLNASGGGGNALTSNPLSQFASTTSAQLASIMSDETGTGALVFATSPSLVTPSLGTPSAAILTNATGLPPAGVSFAATAKLLGRATAGAGVGEEITLGTNLSLTGSTLNAANATTVLAQGQSGLVAYAAPGTGVENYYLGTSAAASLAANAANNIYFGNQAGRFKTTGSFNVGIGYYAQRNSSGVNGTGSGNASIGYSLISATTGSQNAALGYQCLFALTTGNNNVGVGNASGQAITTGSSNVAIGDNALFSVLTATGSVGIGYFAGNKTLNANEVMIGYTAGQLSLTGTASFSGTTSNGSAVVTTASTVGVHAGQFVTGTGVQAGAIVSSFVANTSITMSLPATASGTVTITCASQETAPSVLIGQNAGRFLRDGGNVCLGSNAGGGSATDVNQQAFRTVAVGRSALSALTNGPHNTAVGDAALTGLTTGGSNTAVGRGAGVRLTISGFNSLFGHGAGFYLNPNSGSPYTFTPTNLSSQTLSGDCIYIGNSSGGSTTLNTAATAITGFANIGIGTYTGPGTADVNATIAIGLFANPKASNTTIIGQLQTAALVSGNLASTKALATINNAAGQTLAVAQMFGGYINRSGNIIGVTDTTPTAVQIIASIPGCENGSSYEFTIINGGTALLTLGAGTGVTLSGTTTVANAMTRRYAVIVTNATTGAEAVTVLGLSTSTS